MREYFIIVAAILTAAFIIQQWQKLEERQAIKIIAVIGAIIIGIIVVIALQSTPIVQ